MQARAYQIKAGDAMNRLTTTLFAALALSLASCERTPVAPPLQGAAIGGPFELTGQEGRPVRDTDFAGKYRLVYFGYAFCPDVCPTDLQKLGKAMRDLEKTDPALAAKLVPIFITVDPERDTPPVVKQFVANFHPKMVGLTGSPEATAKVAKQFGVYFKKMPPPTPGGGYLVDHMAAIFLMGPKGEPIALFSQDQSADAIVEGVRRWAR